MNRRRAYSMIELTVTLLIVLIIVSIASAAYFLTERAGSVEGARSELLQAAGNLSSFQQGHGYFPDDAGELKQLEPSIDWTEGLSVKDDEIAVSLTTVDGLPVLGLAMLADAETCVSLTVPPFGSDIVVVRDVFEVGVGADADGVPRGSCSGAEALARAAGSVNSW